MSPQLSAVLPVSGWENFYVIVGSSAAALTGLTFIVITISADRNDRSGADTAARRLAGLRAFISPTVTHFTVSLWISAVLNVPGQTALSLRVCLAAAGLFGAVYCGRVVYWMLRTFTDSQYTPFLEDWAWNAILPSWRTCPFWGPHGRCPRTPCPRCMSLAGLRCCCCSSASTTRGTSCRGSRPSGTRTSIVTATWMRRDMKSTLIRNLRV